ncbi:hypothetical protein PSHT_11075 [Puccinia striiformis]|uniref:Uncharacterized protein n=1 Tax=Puccinia striiformis TaxID=27350 RepID=A0A2S4V5Q0_9BASI|nr:hypothetical protein PSHT_11075 [Puccinia striiformis]
MSHSSDEDDALAEALLKRKTKPQSNPNRRRSSRFNNHQSEEEFSDREADSRHKSHSSPNRTRKSNHNHTVSRKRNRISDFGEEEQEEDEDHGDDLDVNDQDGNNNKDDHDNDNHDDNENDNNNNDDEPDCDMDDNIDELLDELQETHQLDDHYSQIAIKGAKASCNRSDSTTLSGKNAGTSSLPSTPAKDHEKFSNLVREKARALILKTDVESYTSQRDRRGDALDRSLMKLTRTVVEEQPKSFKSQYFPEGYDVPDYAGTKGYCDSLGQLLKYVQGQVYQELNKNVKVPQPAPKITWKRRYRFSHLRLETASHEFNHYPKNITQWNQIDQRLDILQSKSPAFQLRHATLVIEKDEELFPPGGEYKDLNQDGVLMPTLQDVEDSLIDDPPT